MSNAELHVLLLSGVFEVRGSCAYTLRLAEHLPTYGIAPQVICPDARLVEPERRRHLGIVEYSHLDAPLWGRLVQEMLRRDLAQQPPALIHVQSRNVLPMGAWLARRLKCPYIVTVHDYLQPRERLSLDRKWGRRIIAVSESVRDELLEHTQAPRDAVTVIHSGVEVPPEADSRPVLEASRVPVVGTAGPLEAVKGLPFFLGAAQKVLAVHKEVEFLISGAGPEEGNLRRLARDLEITEHITFVPNLTDFTASLAAMDIFCLPSLRQGLGTIMLEAMALGRPVIASGVGGVYSVVRDKETGLVVPPSDSSRLAESILQLLDNPVWARAIGARARETVHEVFGVEKMVTRTAQLYRDVVAEAAAVEPAAAVT